MAKLHGHALVICCTVWQYQIQQLQLYDQRQSVKNVDDSCRESINLHFQTYIQVPCDPHSEIVSHFRLSLYCGGAQVL